MSSPRRSVIAVGSLIVVSLLLAGALFSDSRFFIGVVVVLMGASILVVAALVGRPGQASD